MNATSTKSNETARNPKEPSDEQLKHLENREIQASAPGGSVEGEAGRFDWDVVCDAQRDLMNEDVAPSGR